MGHMGAYEPARGTTKIMKVSIYRCDDALHKFNFPSSFFELVLNWETRFPSCTSQTTYGVLGEPSPVPPCPLGWTGGNYTGGGYELWTSARTQQPGQVATS